MEESDLITKKDLLKMTGISYGQLYRWKRENLIPESWFIKKPSYTGQETYFPRDKILSRISGIIELKDRYSLEELADMLSPELSRRSFNKGDLINIKGIDEGILENFERNFQKSYFNFIEIIFIYIASMLKKIPVINNEYIDEFIGSIISWLPHLDSTSYKLIVYEKKSIQFFLLAKQDFSIFCDKSTRELSSFDLDEVSKDLFLILQDMLKK